MEHYGRSLRGAIASTHPEAVAPTATMLQALFSETAPKAKVIVKRRRAVAPGGQFSSAAVVEDESESGQGARERAPRVFVLPRSGEDASPQLESAETADPQPVVAVRRRRRIEPVRRPGRVVHVVVPQVVEPQSSELTLASDDPWGVSFAMHRSLEHEAVMSALDRVRSTLDEAERASRLRF